MSLVKEPGNTDCGDLAEYINRLCARHPQYKGHFDDTKTLADHVRIPTVKRIIDFIEKQELENTPSTPPDKTLLPATPMTPQTAREKAQNLFDKQPRERLEPVAKRIGKSFEEYRAMMVEKMMLGYLS